MPIFGPKQSWTILNRDPPPGDDWEDWGRPWMIWTAAALIVLLLAWHEWRRGG